MPRRIALVHDWLTGMRGGEKVLEVLCEIFPKADIFTLVHLRGQVSDIIERHKIYTSPLQYIPMIGRYYRHMLPLMPWAIEHFDLSAYDVVISSSHCVAKGAKPREGARHWCYCHTPMRYIWDQFEDYFGPRQASGAVRFAMNAFRPYLQQWDVESSSRVDEFIANSENVRGRIRRIYQRDSCVIYPPVDFDFYSTRVETMPAQREPFYLIVSALAPYKKIDMAIEAFNKMRKKLLIVGEGQDSAKLKTLGNSSIEFLGWHTDEKLRSFYQQAQALIFPGEEDFGIVPLEAMASGCPVIAYAKGGALETVIDNKTGIFFSNPSVNDLISAVQRFEQRTFDPAAIKTHAQRFGRQHCEDQFRRAFVEYRNEMS